MSLESMFQTLKNSDALNNLPLALKKTFQTGSVEWCVRTNPNFTKLIIS